MNFPLVIGGVVAAFFLMKSSSKKSNSPSRENEGKDTVDPSSKVGKFYNIEDPSTFNKKYLLDQRGFVFEGCELTITNQDKMLGFAFNSGKQIKESDWTVKIFDGCDFLNRILDPETQFYIYEIYRYALSGAVVAKKMGNQIALSRLISFKNKIRSSGINTSNYTTTLVKSVS